MEREHVYNVPVATKQEERNKDKRETELSVRSSKRKSRTAKKSSKKFQKVLDKVSELMYNVVTQTRLTQPLTKGKKNANSYKAVR